MRLDRTALAAPLLALLLASCAQGTAPQASPTPTGTGGPTSSSAAPAVGLEVSSLIGNWTVEGTDAEPGTIATIDSWEMRIWTSCGLASAAWRADQQGQFVASIDSWSGDCGARQLRPAWAVTAAGWTTDGADVVLLADDGSPLARLARGGTPTTGPHVLGTQGSPPVLSPDERLRLDAEPSLPDGLRPATRDELVGAWVAEGFADGAGGAPEPPGMTLADDGTWTGTDGCNGGGGRWVADDVGHMLATTGPSTLIGCTGAPVPSWLAWTRMAGFDGEVLVLVDAQGIGVGRLVRA